MAFTMYCLLYDEQCEYIHYCKFYKTNTLNGNCNVNFYITTIYYCGIVFLQLHVYYCIFLSAGSEEEHSLILIS